jgi:hypothetical protein
MSDMIKRFIFERVSENIITKPWMAACYRDYQTREIVMAAWPLNYAITLAWMLNLAWQRYRHRESWIDRMIASEARLKIIQLERERDEAREDAEHWKIEYEIIEARLCGVKHERDNGIVSEREIIPKLRKLVERAIDDLGWFSETASQRLQEELHKQQNNR